MSDSREDNKSKPDSNWVDAEFAGRHGTTASPSSVEDEKAPGFRPQNAHEVAEKVTEEASDEPGIIGTAKKALQEADRQIAGEYEKRDAREAPGQVAEDESGRRVQETQSTGRPGTPNPRVADTAVAAETERFDGLVNESANPPRQPALDDEKRGDGDS